MQVFAALPAITHEGWTVPQLTYMSAETGCEVWRLLAHSQPGCPVTVSVDKARAQRCALGQTVAPTVGMAWRDLPP